MVLHEERVDLAVQIDWDRNPTVFGHFSQGSDTGFYGGFLGWVGPGTVVNSEGRLQQLDKDWLVGLEAGTVVGKWRVEEAAHNVHD